eukprot:TRINITY_DN13987_c0_g1_i1.p1 TRINITY_DN13987_c0_g1~~TRINITY_DN13987_c0_g1_i1.p1  ORF type:complete len:618 (+),score=146.84 TRINITY_DN13987_c0_g1_i1:74-1855(+)
MASPRSAGEWLEAVAPDGRVYYYRRGTREAVWDLEGYLRSRSADPTQSGSPARSLQPMSQPGAGAPSEGLASELRSAGVLDHFDVRDVETRDSPAPGGRPSEGTPAGSAWAGSASSPTVTTRARPRPTAAGAAAAVPSTSPGAVRWAALPGVSFACSLCGGVFDTQESGALVCPHCEQHVYIDGDPMQSPPDPMQMPQHPAPGSPAPPPVPPPSAVWPPVRCASALAVGGLSDGGEEGLPAPHRPQQPGGAGSPAPPPPMPVSSPRWALPRHGDPPPATPPAAQQSPRPLVRFSYEEPDFDAAAAQPAIDPFVVGDGARRVVQQLPRNHRLLSGQVYPGEACEAAGTAAQPGGGDGPGGPGALPAPFEAGAGGAPRRGGARYDARAKWGALSYIPDDAARASAEAAAQMAKVARSTCGRLRKLTGDRDQALAGIQPAPLPPRHVSPRRSPPRAVSSELPIPADMLFETPRRVEPLPPPARTITVLGPHTGADLPSFVPGIPALPSRPGQVSPQRLPSPFESPCAGVRSAALVGPSGMAGRLRPLRAEDPGLVQPWLSPHCLVCGAPPQPSGACLVCGHNVALDSAGAPLPAAA